MKYSPIGLLSLVAVVSCNVKNNGNPKEISLPPIPMERPLDKLGHEFVSNKTQRCVRYQLDNDELTVVSKGSIGTTLLKVSVDVEPRISVLWNGNDSIINGTNPRIHFAARLLGLVETNAVNTITNSTGTIYRFSSFKWSDLSLWNFVDESTKIKYFAVNTFGVISVNLTAHFSADDLKLNSGRIRPNGIKYSIEITGKAVYELQDSSFELIKVLITNLNKTSSLNSNALGDGIITYDWEKSVLSDGVNSTISRSSNLNISFPNTRREAPSSRDGKIDSLHSFNVVSWKLPKFTKSFYWDPSAFVDEAAAQNNALIPSSSVPRSRYNSKQASWFAFGMTTLTLFLI